MKRINNKDEGYKFIALAAFLFLLFSTCYAEAAEYNASYTPGSITCIKAGQTMNISVTLKNMGTQTWNPGTTFLSYHLYQGGAYPVWDGERTSLPKSVAPKETITLSAKVTANVPVGSCTIEWDMLGPTTWFSLKSPPVPTGNQTVEVKSNCISSAITTKPIISEGVKQVISPPKPDLRIDSDARQKVQQQLSQPLPLYFTFPKGGETFEVHQSYTVTYAGSLVGKPPYIIGALIKPSDPCDSSTHFLWGDGYDGSFREVFDRAGSFKYCIRKDPPGTMPPGTVLSPQTVFASSGTFNVTDPRQIKIIYPNGGEVWQDGQTYQVKWDTGGGWGGNVELIILSGDNIRERGHLAMSVKNTGIFSFTLNINSLMTDPTQPPGFREAFSYLPVTKMKVCILPLTRVVMMSGEGYDITQLWDCSDNYFTIVKP